MLTFDWAAKYIGFTLRWLMCFMLIIVEIVLILAVIARSGATKQSRIKPKKLYNKA